MKYNFRLFFKKKNAPSTEKSCKVIEERQNSFSEAVEAGQLIAETEDLRLVMVAELPK
jgi:hypothetical protein